MSIHLVIEHQTTRDRVQETYENGVLIMWRCIPDPPAGEGWEISDGSKDNKTVWRRVRLVEEGSPHDAA